MPLVAAQHRLRTTGGTRWWVNQCGRVQSECRTWCFNVPRRTKKETRLWFLRSPWSPVTHKSRYLDFCVSDSPKESKLRALEERWEARGLSAGGVSHDDRAGGAPERQEATVAGRHDWGPQPAANRYRCLWLLRNTGWRQPVVSAGESTNAGGCNLNVAFDVWTCRRPSKKQTCPLRFPRTVGPANETVVESRRVKSRVLPTHRESVPAAFISFVS